VLVLVLVFLDKWVPVTTARRVLRLQMKERPPIRRVATNILNKQSRTADKGFCSLEGLGEVLTTPHCKNISCYEPFTLVLVLVLKTYKFVFLAAFLCLVGE